MCKFINAALNINAPVGESLDSCTEVTKAYRSLLPDESGRQLVLVDTPGFDDSRDITDTDVLQEISKWLMTTYAAIFLVPQTCI